MTDPIISPELSLCGAALLGIAEILAGGYLRLLQSRGLDMGQTGANSAKDCASEALDSRGNKTDEWGGVNA